MVGYWPGRNGYGFDAPGTIPEVVNNSLVFSWDGTLHLLPALPSAWAKGSISGVLARGQIKIDRLAWDMNAGEIELVLNSAIKQTIDLSLPVKYEIRSVKLNGKDVDLDSSDDVENTHKVILPKNAATNIKITLKKSN